MAIATIYNGIEYRSRLEARWAAFMQNIGWDIVYEPFDGDGYIPDFLVQGAKPLLVEIKPAVTQGEYEAAVPKAERGLESHWQHDILILGASPFPGLMGSSCSQLGHPHPTPTAGWLGERLPSPRESRNPAVLIALELAGGSCPVQWDDFAAACDGEGLLLEPQNQRRKMKRTLNYVNQWVLEGGRDGAWAWDAAEWFTCLSCKRVGVYHTTYSFHGRPCGCYEGAHYLGAVPARVLQSMWADACNDVKWRGKAA